jgi:hypothetical protein
MLAQGPAGRRESAVAVCDGNRRRVELRAPVSALLLRCDITLGRRRRTPPLARQRTKRHPGRILVALLTAGAAAIAGCADGETDTRPVIGTFIGSIEGRSPDRLRVAVVVSESEPGRAQRITLYTCGAGAELLRGRVTGRKATLRSANGNVTATIVLGEEAEPSGSIRIRGAGTHRLVLTRPNGAAGLYTVHTSENTGAGASTNGNLLWFDSVGHEPRATVTEWDGTTHRYVHTIRGDTPPSSPLKGHFVVFEDGSLVGTLAPRGSNLATDDDSLSYNTYRVVAE